MLLGRLAYPNRLSDLECIFKRSRAAMSEIINYVNMFIFTNFGQLLENLGSLNWLHRNRLDLYANVSCILIILKISL